MKLHRLDHAAFCVQILDRTTVFASTPDPLPDAGLSVLRVMAALALVLALFFGGVWMVKNRRRIPGFRRCAPRLNVLEVRSLGGRHALYVVGYEQERFLLASSPTGVNLVSHLQPAEETAGETADKTGGPQPSFAVALTQMLKGK